MLTRFSHSAVLRRSTTKQCNDLDDIFKGKEKSCSLSAFSQKLRKPKILSRSMPNAYLHFSGRNHQSHIYHPFPKISNIQRFAQNQFICRLKFCKSKLLPKERLCDITIHDFFLEICQGRLNHLLMIKSQLGQLTKRNKLSILRIFSILKRKVYFVRQCKKSD